jgi:alpha-glucosidase (family GH31 glycosyl hydrolase)
MESTDGEVALVTSRLRVMVNRADGAIEYHDAAGKRLLQEGTRNMTPARVNGEDTWHAELSFSIYASQEAFYGLGQQQAGVWNYRGESVDLSQDNTVIAVPLLVSTNGYGLFWNNMSRSRFNGRFVQGLYLVRQVGLRLLAVQEPLPLPRGVVERGAPVPPDAHPGRQHRAGLVLVGHHGFVPVQQKPPRCEGHGRRSASQQLPPDDFHLAVWLDTNEPETGGREENIITRDHTAIGSGARYANIFPLMHDEGVYQGQRSETDRKRVFILSRSAFAGIQRDGVAAWSGDVRSTFDSFKRQIPAGLNYSLSGLPYWTTDIGGFYLGNPDDAAYRELFVRWFQYGSFCPIFRVHGTRSTDPAELSAWGPEAIDILVDAKGTRAPSHNELWSYGPEAQKILTAFDRLRYRLMPYIYSLAWKTTSEGYTPMRALAMDFRTDARVLSIGDQFMFGPAILVNPVTEQGATTRHLYLPVSGWYDFWTGSSVTGGKMVDAAAPLDRIPLYVRAGSIVPMGPDVEYATEKPADPIELRVYAGADGDFTLYEDENDNYNYEKGAYATIPIHWNDAGKQLTIGERKGSFPGMMESRTFRVTFVGPGRGTGVAPAARADTVVAYSGKAVTVLK